MCYAGLFGDLGGNGCAVGLQILADEQTRLRLGVELAAHQVEVFAGHNVGVSLYAADTRQLTLLDGDYLLGTGIDTFINE